MRVTGKQAARFLSGRLSLITMFFGKGFFFKYCSFQVEKIFVKIWRRWELFADGSLHERFNLY